MCILLNVKKHEKTFALNVDIFKTPRKLLFLKEMLDAPQFLCYNIRANGRYRSFFYAQKTIAMNREKTALQRN